MRTTTTVLEALAMVRAGWRGEVETANLVYTGSSDRGALVGTLTMLCVHLFEAVGGEDVGASLDRLVVEELSGRTAADAEA